MEKFIEFIHSDLGIALVGVIGGVIGSILGAMVAHLLSEKDKKEDKVQNKLENCLRELEQLRTQLSIYETVEPSATGDYLVQKGMRTAICPICWPDRHKAIPIYEDNDTGKFTCSCCHHTGIFDKEKVQRIKDEERAASDDLIRNLVRMGSADHGEDDFYDGILHRY